AGVQEASRVCRVLEEDPDLAEAIAPEHRAQASLECIARTLSVPAGPWRASQAAMEGEGIGLLVMRGLLSAASASMDGSAPSCSARAISCDPGRARTSPPCSHSAPVGR